MEQPTNDVGRFVETHGASRSPVYGVWGNMIYRCHCPTAPNFADYGGRGITVCDRWRYDFATFAADMGPRPAGHSIERLDNAGNYELGNCKWATPAEQAANRRSARIVEGMTAHQIAQASGLPKTLVKQRIGRGWNLARILAQPRRAYPEHAHVDR